MKLSEITGEAPPEQAPPSGPTRLSQLPPESAPAPTAPSPPFWPPSEYVARTVVPPVVNFLTAPIRGAAADVVATVDATQQQSPSIERWWDQVAKSMEASSLPETAGGKHISDVLNIPGEIIMPVVKGASELVLGRETTKQVAPFAKTGADVAGIMGIGRLTRGREEPFGPAIPPRPPETPETRAADVIGKRIKQDEKYGGPTATDALSKVVSSNAGGKPLVLADVGGENISALAGFVGRKGGEARSASRSFLEARDKGASERLGRDVSQYIFGGPTMLETADTLMKGRSATARPLYQQFEEAKGLWSPRLQEFINDPAVKSGLARGYELERLDSLAEGRPFNPTALGVDLDYEGNIVLKKVPNPRVLDMGKRGLDAMIADERDITGRLSARGVALSKARQAYLDEIDGLDTAGTYKAARDAWAGPSQSLDAMKWGRTIFSRAPEETARDFGKLSANNQEFVRMGVADVLRERIAKTGFSGDESRALIKNSWTRDQLRPIFRSDAEFDKFADAVMAEHSMAVTHTKVARGSQTAERVAADKEGISPEIVGSAGRLARDVLHGNIPMAILEGYRIRRRLQKDVGDDPALNEAVAKILFSPALKLEDEAAQRIMAGPPPNPTPYKLRQAAGTVGRYAPAVAAMGISEKSALP